LIEGAIKVFKPSKKKKERLVVQPKWRGGGRPEVTRGGDGERGKRVYHLDLKLYITI